MLLLSIGACLQNEANGQVNNFGFSYAHSVLVSGDSSQKAFFTYNQSLIMDLVDEFGKLPIDRCRHGHIQMMVNIDSSGIMQNIMLQEGSGLAKQDSNITRVVKSLDGKWKMVVIDNLKTSFTGAFSYVLNNTNKKVARTRDIKYGLYTTTVTKTLSKTYDYTKNCEDADFYYEAGVKEFQGENYKRAIYDFTQVLKANPYDLDALFNLSVTYFKVEKKVEGCECLRKATEYGDMKSASAFDRNCK
jgi:tetratricopeptide (TPR) repeat protein